MAGICKHDGCGKPVNSYGWCRGHWALVKKYGEPEPVAAKLRLPLATRFWRLVIKQDGCWGWSGSLGFYGYGRIGAGGRRAGVMLAHRVSYEIHNGPIPDGMIVMHKCDNTVCTNPDHLQLGTKKENTADMLAKSRGRWDVAKKLKENST